MCRRYLVAAKLPLSDLIESVTNELQKAKVKAEKRGTATMLFDECEFEFGIEAEKSAEGGVNVWVIELGAGIKKTETNTIRIKFKSNPDNPIQAPAEIQGAGPELQRQT
jgi:hypothetical protein